MVVFWKIEIFGRHILETSMRHIRELSQSTPQYLLPAGHYISLMNVAQKVIFINDE